MSNREHASIREFHAEFGGVKLPFGLELDRVAVSGHGVGIQREPFAIEVEEPGTLEATVTDLGLQAFLEKKAAGGLRDFFVQLSEGEVHVHATARMIVEIRAVAICTLDIVDGTQLFVRLKKVDVLGVGARGLVQKHLDEINPVLDVADLPVSATLTAVEVGGGKIVIRGTVAPKKS